MISLKYSNKTIHHLYTAGSECIYLGDGSIKIKYMDFCSDKPICRSQHYMKKREDKNGYDRCCCQFNFKQTPDDSIRSLWAPDCVFKEDGSLIRWSIIKSGNDLTCHPGFKMHNTISDAAVQ